MVLHDLCSKIINHWLGQTGIFFLIQPVFVLNNFAYNSGFTIKSKTHTSVKMYYIPSTP